MNHLSSLVCGDTWLLVTSLGFTRRGVVDKLRSLVSHANLIVHDQASPNPDLDELDSLTDQLRSKDLKGILALGGGSVLDTAKVLSVTVPSQIECPLNRIFRLKNDITWADRLSLIAVPTTSGTGAEVTPFSTVWDFQGAKKHSLSGEKVYPDTALLDPELTLSLPYFETLYTGLDTISHGLESLWNKNQTRISRSYAYECLRLALEALPEVLNDPDNLEKREKMQLASLFGGLAISQTKTAIAHSISYPLTCHFHVPHGLACSFMLPRLIEKNRESLSDNQLLLEDLQSFLSGLNLDEELAKYVSREQFLSLVNQMVLAERADNYISDNVNLKEIVLSD